MGCKVLVTGADAPAARSMIDALHSDSVTLLACDCQHPTGALDEVPAECRFTVHRSDHPEFVGDLVQLCVRHDIDVVVPMCEMDQVALTRVRKLFEGLGASVWLAPIPAHATRSQARRIVQLGERAQGQGRAAAMGQWFRRFARSSQPPKSPLRDRTGG
jgi:hypothetical protein